MEETNTIQKKKRTSLKIFFIILAVIIIGIIIIIAIPKEPIKSITYNGVAETYSDETWFTLNIETRQTTFIDASSFSIMSNDELITAKGFVDSSGIGYSYKGGLSIDGSRNVILCFELRDTQIDSPIKIFYNGDLIS